MKSDYLEPSVYYELYKIMQYKNVLAMRVCLETGLRIDDVLSIKPAQLKGRTLRGTAKKTGKPYRKVLSKELADRLKDISGTAYLFPHRTKANEHRRRQTVWKDVKKAAQILGIEINATPHSARKTYAVNLYHNEGLEATQKQLQHDKGTTTMLYAFSDILTKSVEKKGDYALNGENLETFAEIVAEKTAKKILSVLKR